MTDGCLQGESKVTHLSWRIFGSGNFLMGIAGYRNFFVGIFGSGIFL